VPAAAWIHAENQWIGRCLGVVRATTIELNDNIPDTTGGTDDLVAYAHSDIS
jgi:hypothetical protein